MEAVRLPAEEQEEFCEELAEELTEELTERERRQHVALGVRRCGVEARLVKIW